MSGPDQVVETAIYNKLSGGTALIAHLGGTAIYAGIAPNNTPLPVVIFQWQGGGDENDSPRRTRNEVWTVKAISTSKSQAGTIDGDIDALLHMKTLSITGYTNFWTAREGSVNYVEVDAGGTAIFHRGAMYRIWMCA